MRRPILPFFHTRHDPSSRPSSNKPPSKWRRLKFWRDWKDIGFTILAIIYFIICIYLVAVANAYDDRTVRKKSTI